MRTSRILYQHNVGSGFDVLDVGFYEYEGYILAEIEMINVVYKKRGTGTALVLHLVTYLIEQACTKDKALKVFVEPEYGSQEFWEKVKERLIIKGFTSYWGASEISRDLSGMYLILDPKSIEIAY